MTPDNNSEQNNEFAKFLEESLVEKTSFEPGQQIKAKIVATSNSCVFLHLGGKSEGIIEADELTDDEGNLTVNVGDTIEAFFLSSQDGELLFTTRIKNEKAGKALIENAFENGIPVEGVVEKERKGGYEVRIGESRAFCPYSQMGLKRVEDSSIYIGKTLTFKIQEYSEKGRNIIVSNRVILQEELEARKADLKKTLQENMKVKGVVKSIQNFGAFVEVQGIQTLLPISEISRERVEDITEILKVGQEIDAVILKLNWQTERISISMKQLLPDPWEEASAKYKLGSRHTGKIVRLVNYGAFVELEPGLDGLIHISDFDVDKRINHPREVVKEGQSLEVEVNNVDLDKKRISLKQKPKAKSPEEDYSAYMDDDTDTYNPFSALLKDKKKQGK